MSQRGESGKPNSDAVISRKGLDINLHDVIYTARETLKHRVFQLQYSRDASGVSHEAHVQAVAAFFRQKLDEMERFLQEQAQ